MFRKKQAVERLFLNTRTSECESPEMGKSLGRTEKHENGWRKVNKTGVAEM